MRALQNKVVTRISIPSLCFYKHEGGFLFDLGGIFLEPIVELRGLSKTFGAGAEQVAALQNVSVSVQPG